MDQALPKPGVPGGGWLLMVAHDQAEVLPGDRYEREHAPASQTMTGTVDEWQAWTGMAFPSSGEYVIPAGLSTLRIDRERDCGTCTELNVWVRHR